MSNKIIKLDCAGDQENEKDTVLTSPFYGHGVPLHSIGVLGAGFGGQESPGTAGLSGPLLLRENENIRFARDQNKRTYLASLSP